MSTLNPRQWEAVEAAQEHVLVAAGAGTGKTHTVVNRILYTMGIEVNGRRHPAPMALKDLAAITFTNAAAADLKRKLREALHAAGRRAEAWEVDTARVGTIHSFCADVLREFALRSGRGILGTVLDEAKGAEQLVAATREAVLTAAEAGRPEVDALLGNWSIGEVEGFVRALAGDADRLAGYVARGGGLGGHEQALLSLAVDAQRLLRGRLAERGELDFDGLIVETRDLLRDDAGVRAALQRRLRLLVIDEFQDTDPAQREIAYLLGDPDGRRTDTTRLLLVGDPKQSIYRFRRADVTVWRQVEHDFVGKALGKVVTLEDNFRSVPAILGFVDAIVGPVLDQPVSEGELQEFEVPFAPVRAAPPRPETGEEALGSRPTDLAVELIVVPPDEEGKRPNSGAFRSLEAATVARRMAELHRDGVPQHEMAVLLSSWGDVEIYESALRAAGLSTYAARGEGFLERRETMDLVLALQTVRDPDDDRALLGFLRSPWVGLSDESLLRIATGGAPPYWSHLAAVALPEKPEQERLACAITLLNEVRPLRDRLPVAELVELLLLRTGYMAHLALGGEEKRQALANVRQFVALARANADAGVGEFLRRLRDMQATEVRIGDARLYDAREEVVTLTSIHAAKGLEWQVVAWCDLGREPMDRPGGLLLGRSQFAIRRPGAGEDAQPEPWPTLRAREREESAAERKRLWYVAATRAKDRLILAGFHPIQSQKSQSPATMLQEWLPGLAWRDGETVAYASEYGESFTATVRVAVPAPEAGKTAAPLTVAELVAGLPDVAVPVGERRHSATSLMGFHRCARRHWIKYVAGLREPAVPGSEGALIDAMVRGQIVHDVLERCREEDELDRLLEEAIRQRDEDAPGLEGARGRSYRDHLREEVRRIRTIDPYREMDATPGSRRELSFLHLAGDGWFLEGAMDLAAPAGGALRLLDVKTSQADAERVREIADHYRLQRSVYIGAAEAVSGRTVTQFVFQFSGAGIPVASDITPDIRREAVESVRDTREKVAAGGSAANAEPHECRFCGYHRVGWCSGSTRGGKTGTA
jgi:ATP-dependent helicase/nuclease subunit A